MRLLSAHSLPPLTSRTDQDKTLEGKGPPLGPLITGLLLTALLSAAGSSPSKARKTLLTSARRLINGKYYIC